MNEQTQIQPERRRVERIALSLSATVRTATRSKVKVKVIDMSTDGCRVECSSVVADDSRIWLSIEGLEAQHCRVVWHCQEFVGVEFETPLSEAVFDRLLAGHKQLPESAIQELRTIASRTHSLARQAGDGDIALLAELSRKCAVDAVVEGLRLGRPSAKPPSGAQDG
jgi:hypothetical protein